MRTRTRTYAQNTYSKHTNLLNICTHVSDVILGLLSGVPAQGDYRNLDNHDEAPASMPRSSRAGGGGGGGGGVAGAGAGAESESSAVAVAVVASVAGGQSQ
jgi:uncharacterized membrane protein